VPRRKRDQCGCIRQADRTKTKTRSVVVSKKPAAVDLSFDVAPDVPSARETSTGAGPAIQAVRRGAAEAAEAVRRAFADTEPCFMDTHGPDES
jgi:hypothetical protein